MIREVLDLDLWTLNAETQQIIGGNRDETTDNSSDRIKQWEDRMKGTQKKSKGGKKDL